MCGHNLTMKFSKLHMIERVCELLLLIYHHFTKQNDFRLQALLICKKKKKTYEKWLLGGVLQKTFSENFTRFTEYYLY